MRSWLVPKWTTSTFV